MQKIHHSIRTATVQLWKGGRMGDCDGNPTGSGVPEESNVFFVGEERPHSKMPAQLRERLFQKRQVDPDQLVAKEKERGQRIQVIHFLDVIVIIQQDINDKRKQKLQDHHEKVDRLREQKKLAKQKETLLSADDNFETEAKDVEPGATLFNFRQSG